MSKNRIVIKDNFFQKGQADYFYDAVAAYEKEK